MGNQAKAVGANLLFGVDNLAWLSIFIFGQPQTIKKGVVVKPLKLRLVMYVGGYQNQTKPAQCNATIDEKGFTLEKLGFGFTKKTIIEAGWDKIKEVSIDVPDQNGRITASRVLLTGIFALALKKKQNFLVVKLTDGEVVCKTGLANGAVPTANAQLVNMVANWGAKSELVETPISAADELAKYAALTEKGVITKAEFEVKKKQLLN